MSSESPGTFSSRMVRRWEVHGLSRAYELKNTLRPLRPIYVCGFAGSGTTMLAYLLSASRTVSGVVRESARTLPRGSGMRIEKMDHYPSLEEYESALRLGPADRRQVRRSYGRLYKRAAQRPGNVVIDKGPNANLYRVEPLHDAFPDAAFVLLLRDPIAVVEGLMRKWALFRTSGLDRTIGFCASALSSFRDAREEQGIVHSTVTYEDLVASPDTEVARLRTELNLGPPGPPITLDKLRVRGNRPGKGARNVKEGVPVVVPGANELARKRLSDHDVARIQARLSW